MAGYLPERRGNVGFHRMMRFQGGWFGWKTNISSFGVIVLRPYRAINLWRAFCLRRAKPCVYGWCPFRAGCLPALEGNVGFHSLFQVHNFGKCRLLKPDDLALKGQNPIASGAARWIKGNLMFFSALKGRNQRQGHKGCVMEKVIFPISNWLFREQ